MPTRPPFRRRRLGARLQAMRVKARMTLDDAAMALDKTRSTLHRVEQGETRADIHSEDPLELVALIDRVLAERYGPE